jgi:uncharacterized protein YbjQ (UPF0145 family)
MGWVLLFYLWPLLLLLLTYIVGKLIEQSHQRSLLQREAAARDILVTNLRQPPEGYVACEQSLCIGSAVIGSDYFKRFGASLKTLIGGRLRTLESLLQRGRREAILRVIEQARQQGADMICNIRIETSRLGVTTAGDKKSMFAAAAEVVAYGTALRRDERATPYRG